MPFHRPAGKEDEAGTALGVIAHAEKRSGKKIRVNERMFLWSLTFDMRATKGDTLGRPSRWKGRASLRDDLKSGRENCFSVNPDLDSPLSRHSLPWLVE